MSLNTAIDSGSPYFALMARIHGTCEIHGWFPEEDRTHFAGVIEQGLARNIFRKDMGWQDVVDLFLCDYSEGPVVMSYSVCDTFPNAHIAGWPVEDDDWVRHLSHEDRWDHAFRGLSNSTNPSLKISKRNLETQGFGTGKTFWNLLASDDWLDA